MVSAPPLAARRACRAHRQEHGELLDRAHVVGVWFTEEHTAAVEMMRNANLVGDRTETEAYLYLLAERYRLLRTHAWTDEVIERLRRLRTGSRR